MAREIKSPSTSVEDNNNTTIASDVNNPRKKLQVYFVESDDRRTALGGGYTNFGAAGATPVNIRGKPISNLSGTGGWIAAFFIFG